MVSEIFFASFKSVIPFSQVIYFFHHIFIRRVFSSPKLLYWLSHLSTSRVQSWIFALMLHSFSTVSISPLVIESFYSAFCFFFSYSIITQICITGILCTLIRLVLINIDPGNPFQKIVYSFCGYFSSYVLRIVLVFTLHTGTPELGGQLPPLPFAMGARGGRGAL